MDRIKVLVVDDEPLAREELSRLLTEIGGVDITEACTGEEALERIRTGRFDVAFFDIEMPGKSGLEIASELLDIDDPPFVVFATAFHQYAVDAFEAQAIDYVLKPYEAERLKKAMDRVREALLTRASVREKLVSLESYLIQKGTLKKIVGHRRNSRDRVVIRPEEVCYFQARYAEVFAQREQDELIVNATLKETLANLNPSQFAQVHKAYIVNIDKIEQVSPMFSGNFEIRLKTDKLKPIPLSRRYARTLKKLLGNW